MKKPLLFLASSILMLAACGGNNNASSTPASTPKSPDVSSVAPASEPEGQSSKHEDPASVPEVVSSEEEEPASIPEAPASEPEAPVSEPEAPVSEPETPISEPEAPVSEPEVPISEPETPISEPAASEPIGSEPEVEKIITNTDASLVKDDQGHVFATISGTFSGYTAAEVEELDAYFDVESNSWYVENSWTNFHRYLADATIIRDVNENGTFTIKVDITELSAYAYTVHFGWGVTKPSGDATDTKLGKAIDQTVTEGTKEYHLVCYTDGAEDGKKFWNNLGLIVSDLSEPSAELTGVTLTEVEGKPIITYVISYANYTFAEVSALDWAADFQNNDNVWHTGWTTHSLSLNFVDAGNNILHITADLSGFDAGQGYTGHFGIRYQEGNNLKTPDFKFTAEDVAVVVNNIEYKLDFDASAYWNTVALIVTDMSLPYYEVAGVDIAEKEGRAIVTYTVNYRNYTYDEISALDWGADFQRNDNTDHKGWNRHWVNLSLIEGDEGVMLATADVTDLESGLGYTSHFGVKYNSGTEIVPPDLKIDGEDHGVTIGHKFYFLDYASSGYWGCVGLIISNASTYSFTDLPNWIGNDGALVFAHVWNTAGYAAWHKLSEEYSFIEGENITGMLLVRCIAGTEVPNWDVAGDAVGRIYNKTGNIEIIPGVYSYEASNWVEYTPSN